MCNSALSHNGEPFHQPLDPDLDKFQKVITSKFSQALIKKIKKLKKIM